MLTDKTRPSDMAMDATDYPNYPLEEGLMTPDQYNGTLEYRFRLFST